MCSSCETAIAATGCARQAGPRNQIVPGARDTDSGPDTEGRAASQLTPALMQYAAQLETLRYGRLTHDAVFDASHPVDEYAPQGMLANGSPPAGSTVTLNIQPDYDMPERYESCAVLIPAGALTVSLQLGQRNLQLRSASSGTDIGNVQPAWMNLTFTGLILNADDTRQLTVVYAAQATTTVNPTEPFVSLTGYALTRGQFS